MNASPLLLRVLKALRLVKLEAILFGNAGAAIHGAPVTTVDFDFYFRDTPQNRVKLKELAKKLDATIYRPYYPVSSLFRISNDEIGLQIDLLAKAHGIKSFASLRSRAVCYNIFDEQVSVASLEDIIKSKHSAGRASDKAVLEILRRVYETQKETKKTKA